MVVQGIPKAVEDDLIGILRKFTWNNAKRPLISLDRLYADKEEGGIGLIDIRARNKATEIVWVKKFLTFGEKRPLWAAYVVDDLVLIATPKNQPNF